jgi:uncharacterized protein (DUF1778 family)
MAGKSEYRNGWIAEKLDRINLTVPKGRKDIIRAHAEAQGESVNAFINRAISEAMVRDGAPKEYVFSSAVDDIAAYLDISKWDVIKGIERAKKEAEESNQ